MADVKFYIIIPTYNRFDKIKKAIQSVLQQIYDKYHIIIVDDHSDKNNHIQLEKYTNCNDRISYYYLPENRGHCYARNFALSKISELDSWIKYLDDDDLILPNCLKDIADYISNNKQINVLTTNFDILNEHDEMIKHIEPNYNIDSVFNGNLDTCCICHKYSLFKEIGGWDEFLYRMADDDFFFKYITNGEYGFLNKTTSIFYRTSDKSRVSNQTSNLKYVNYIANKYKFYYNKKCLIICDNKYVDDILNTEFNIESFIKFDINKKPSKDYDYLIYIKDFNILQDLYGELYRTKEDLIKIKNSMLIKNRLR